jgi:TRAP-type C4-dicarboxylate transport system substrate-binding protein
LVAEAGQFYTRTRHMLEINYAPLVGAAVIRKSVWDALPPNSQDALRRASAEAGKTIQRTSREDNDKAVASMVAKHGLKVHPVTPAIQAEWQETAKTMYPKIRGGMVPADLYDRAVAALSEYRARKPATP